MRRRGASWTWAGSPRRKADGGGSIDTFGAGALPVGDASPAPAPAPTPDPEPDWDPDPDPDLGLDPDPKLGCPDRTWPNDALVGKD